MVIGLRDLDERSIAVEQLVHVLPGLGQDDSAELTAHQRNTATHARQVVVQRFGGKTQEYARIEFPGPAGVR